MTAAALTPTLGFFILLLLQPMPGMMDDVSDLRHGIPFFNFLPADIPGLRKTIPGTMRI
jgi:hypothetical protein